MARGCRPAARGGGGGAGGAGEHLEPPFEHLNLENNIPKTNKQTNKQIQAMTSSILNRLTNGSIQTAVGFSVPQPQQMKPS